MKLRSRTGVAVVNFLYWLIHRDPAEPVSEISVAEKLLAFRRQQPDFVSNSFDPIMAYDAHSAMCHYSATAETDRLLDRRHMFLTDSGGNYLTGTTDITRTLCLGTPTLQQMRDYTLVLKGHIAVATACFPEGTRGFSDRHPGPAVPVAAGDEFRSRHRPWRGVFSVCP